MFIVLYWSTRGILFAARLYRKEYTATENKRRFEKLYREYKASVIPQDNATPEILALCQNYDTE